METENPQPPERRPPFDKAIAEHVKETFKEILTKFPEVRSLAASVDYYGTLNDAQVNSGVWIGDEGNVTRADALFGSLMQALKLVELMFSRSMNLAAQLRDRVTVLASEIKNKNEELKRLNDEIAAKKASQAG